MNVDNYARMLLFVIDFFVYTGKSRQNLAPRVIPGLLRDYKAVASMLSKKQNVYMAKTIVKGFISINIISTPYFNSKIAVNLFFGILAIPKKKILSLVNLFFGIAEQDGVFLPQVLSVLYLQLDKQFLCLCLVL